MRFTHAIVTVLALAAGCVGGIENTDPKPTTPDAAPPVSGSMARTMYTTNVHAITMRCNGGACHSVTNAAGGGASRFADANADTSYDAIIRAPLAVGSFNNMAGILTKIAGGHNAITYSAGDISNIQAWLAQESKERMNTNQPPPVDPIEVLKKWSGCMTIANFNTAQMAQKWGSLAANGQLCSNCHGSGAFAFIATTNATTMFDMMSKHKDYLLKFFSVDATGKVVVNLASITNAATTLEGHPRFDPMNNAGVTALQTFYMSTSTAMTGTTPCDPPRLID